jgi:hypothetical protein
MDVDRRQFPFRQHWNEATIRELGAATPHAAPYDADTQQRRRRCPPPLR